MPIVISDNTDISKCNLTGIERIHIRIIDADLKKFALHKIIHVKGKLKIADNQIHSIHNCASFSLECHFKDVEFLESESPSSLLYLTSRSVYERCYGIFKYYSLAETKKYLKGLPRDVLNLCRGNEFYLSKFSEEEKSLNKNFFYSEHDGNIFNYI